jgi:HK97 gp10 family phage protein
MAKMSYEMPTDMIRKLSALQSKYDSVVDKVLTEGVAPLEEAMKGNLAKSIGKATKQPSQSTGELLESLSVTRPYQSTDGDWNIKVGCAGYDSRGVPNPLKAAVLEKGKSGQRARPWAKPAARAAKEECIKKMQEALDAEVKRL